MRPVETKKMLKTGKEWFWKWPLAKGTVPFTKPSLYKVRARNPAL
jgi:hypothetical protein